MKRIKDNINISSLTSFLIIGGTPLIMLLYFYFFGFEESTLLVISTKLLLFICVLYYYKTIRLSYNGKTLIGSLFYFFWGLWFIRVFIDGFLLNNNLMHDTSKYYLFAIFFAIVPFSYGNTIKSDKDIVYVSKGVVFSIVIFCFATLLLFYDTLSNVHRIGSEDGSINPLNISYLAAMSLAYFVWKIIIDKLTFRRILMIVITIPLIGIGASKGSIVALALSLLVIFFVNRKINFRFLILFILSFLVIYNADLLFLGTLKDRFTHSIDANLYSSERELRYYLWNFSIDKFVDNPIFGYSLEISNRDLEMLNSPAYPHNIILESFLSLGLIGGGLLVTIIIVSIKNGIYIAKNKLDESWILLLFLIAFYQNMFSGNLYSGAIWFWFFVGLINGRYKYLQLQKENPYILPKN